MSKSLPFYKREMQQLQKCEIVGKQDENCRKKILKKRLRKKIEIDEI